MTRFEIKPFHLLTLDELYAVMQLRDIVFVVGQKITAASEIDGLDPQCHHAMLWDGDRLVGTARVFADRDPCVVGRVAVHTQRQREGLGTTLMQHVQRWLGTRPAELHAQSHLEGWYASLGWTRHGNEFVEAEIPHVTMRR